MEDTPLLIVRWDQPPIIRENSAYLNHVALIKLVAITTLLYKENIGRNIVFALFVESVDVNPSQRPAHFA